MDLTAAPTFTFLNPSIDKANDMKESYMWKDWYKKGSVKVKTIKWDFKEAKKWVPDNNKKLPETVTAVKSLIPPASNEAAVAEVIKALCPKGAPCFDDVVSVACPRGPDFDPDRDNLVRLVLQNGGEYYTIKQDECGSVKGFKIIAEVTPFPFPTYCKLERQE